MCTSCTMARARRSKASFSRQAFRRAVVDAPSASRLSSGASARYRVRVSSSRMVSLVAFTRKHMMALGTMSAKFFLTTSLKYDTSSFSGKRFVVSSASSVQQLPQLLTDDFTAHALAHGARCLHVNGVRHRRQSRCERVPGGGEGNRFVCQTRRQRQQNQGATRTRICCSHHGALSHCQR